MSKITLTTAQCLLINAGFPGLDGFMKAVGEKAIAVPFKFSDETRVKLRRWRRAVKAIAEEFSEANQDLVKELSPEKQNVEEETLAVRIVFANRIKPLQQEKHEIDLPKIKLTGELLNEGKNPISDSVLDALDPIIEDEVPSAAAAEQTPGGDD